MTSCGQPALLPVEVRGADRGGSPIRGRAAGGGAVGSWPVGSAHNWSRGVARGQTSWGGAAGGWGKPIGAQLGQLADAVRVTATGRSIIPVA